MQLTRLMVSYPQGKLLLVVFYNCVYFLFVFPFAMHVKDDNEEETAPDLYLDQSKNFCQLKGE